MVKKLLEKGLLEQNPIIEPIGAISAGIVNNEVMVDLCYQEDSNAQVDSNVVLTASGKIIEFQTTAEGKGSHGQIGLAMRLSSERIQR